MTAEFTRFYSESGDTVEQKEITAWSIHNPHGICIMVTDGDAEVQDQIVVYEEELERMGYSRFR